MATPHSKAYAYEKRLAKRLKGKRIIDQSKGDCDIVSSWLCVEAFQKAIPDYLKEEVMQAVRASAKRGWKHMPITVWREKGKKDDEALVVIRLCDWEAWYI